MKTLTLSPLDVVWERLRRSYPPEGPDWGRFFSARWERDNFASRYHLVYPGLACYTRIGRHPETAAELRPLLDVMYQGLISERCWAFWHAEMEETTGAIAERNLTYAGRLAMFVGLYIDAFGEPPAPTVDVDGDSITYNELSARLWRQMTESPSCGVSCYHHEAMVMCNAVLLINNLLHDRLFGTSYAASNDRWLHTVRDHLVADPSTGPLFFYGTLADSPEPNAENVSLGMDAWALALMSATASDEVTAWFDKWRHHLHDDGDTTWVPISEGQERIEDSTTELATAWILVLAAELGDTDLHDRIDNHLAPRAVTGFRVDPYISGLYALGHELQPGGLRRLITEPA